MTRLVKWILPVLILFGLTHLLQAQTQEKKPDPWDPWKFFIGNWEGTAKGEPGESKVKRSYQFVLQRKFILLKNKAIYLPQEKTPQGEVHKDWGLFSYDMARKKFILRQFHVEGFVNQYVLDNIAPDGKTLVFVTESIENIPAGWRARETYKLVGNDELVEIFELAPPGKDFSVYSETHLKKTGSFKVYPVE